MHQKLVTLKVTNQTKKMVTIKILMVVPKKIMKKYINMEKWLSKTCIKGQKGSFHDRNYSFHL